MITRRNKCVGAWRSLVAYLNGVQRAEGSNPSAPTMNFKGLTILSEAPRPQGKDESEILPTETIPWGLLVSSEL